ncbi:MAG: glycosyltransferase family 2 protein [Candidatus Omnitrophica bacterium]|nr:glycosyltransferase family 2 protein [Candidatus Omnitrophota bacterium]
MQLNNLSEVIIGTTLAKLPVYILKEFFDNQKEIQQSYPNSELVISTSDNNFRTDIPKGLNCEIINYRKPSVIDTDNHFIGNKIRIRDMVEGRNTVRSYFLESNAEYFLSVDADMIYDPNLISILMAEIKNYDIVMSGYMKKNDRLGYSLGCALIRREVLERVKFNCLIFPSSLDIPNIVEDGWMFEHDAIQQGFKIKRGIFVEIEHVISKKERLRVKPRRTTFLEKIKTNSAIRYLIVKLCILTKRDLPRIILKKIGGRL